MISTCSIRSLLVLTSVVVFTAPLYSQVHRGPDDRWIVRGFGEGIAADIDDFVAVDVLDFAIGFEANDDVGFGAALEYRFSRRLGLELSVSRTEPEIALALIPTLLPADFPGSIPVTSLGLALPIHLTPDAAIDLWIAPALGYFQFGTLRFEGLGGLGAELEGGDDLAPGVRLGLDIPFGSARWGLHLGASYHDVDLALAGPGRTELTLGFDHLGARLGVSVEL